MLKEYGLLFSREIGCRSRQHVRELLVKDHVLGPIIDPLLAIHKQVCRQQRKLDDEIRRLALADATTRRLMTVPGVGVVMALTFRHRRSFALSIGERRRRFSA